MILRSRHKLAKLMTLETARQIATVGLVCWFVFLSTAIHGLHRHDGGVCGACGREFCTIEPYGYASESDSSRVGYLLESGNAPQSDFQLCPACDAVFKLTLERCTEQITVQIEKTESESYDPGKNVFDSLFVWVSASPRAPPLSLTS